MPRLIWKIAVLAVLGLALGGSAAALAKHKPKPKPQPRHLRPHHPRKARRLRTPPGGTAPAPGGPAPTPGGSAPAPAVALGWPTFGYDNAHSGASGAPTAINAANVASLAASTVQLDGTVDSAPIELTGVGVDGAARNIFVVTTTYGRTEAIDAATGSRLWEFTPSDISSYLGSAQVVTATPVVDPDDQYVYAASPDGVVHKLSVATGAQVWQTAVTKAPKTEKMDGGLTYADGELIVVTGGYIGDIPPYQGHIVTLDPATGQITHVWNSLCSNVTTLMDPSTCQPSDAAIWGRGGAILEPDGNILVATGNAPFNGSTNWGDSVLELSPSLALLHNWTPANQATLNSSDLDLGSTEPALLPDRNGTDLAVQGGKDGILRLLNLKALDGGTGPAGPTTGGELQTVDAPGPTDVFSQPAVYTTPAGATYVYVTDGDGTAAFSYGSDNRLHPAWSNTTSGTSPVVAGGMLWIFDQQDGRLDVYAPATGALIASLPAAAGHWNSPIVIGNSVALPVGNYQSHATSGQMLIYRLPG